MKKFSKFVYAILFALISILSFQGLIFSAPENKKSHAIDMNVNGIFDYISVSQENQTINASNIRVSADGLTAYVIAKNSISIKFEPLRYNYSFSIDRLPAADLETYFYIDWSEEISIRPEGGTITYNGRNFNQLLPSCRIHHHRRQPEHFHLDNSKFSALLTLKI